MKKMCLMLIIGVLAVGLATAYVPGAALPSAMYVAVRQLPLKFSTGFFASTGGILEYGDQVTVLQTSGKFAEIQSTLDTSLSGWVPAANLSRQNLCRGETVTEVENSFRAQRNLNFTEVDKVEAIPVSEFYLKMFLEEGRLFMGDN